MFVGYSMALIRVIDDIILNMMLRTFLRTNFLLQTQEIRKTKEKLLNINNKTKVK